MLYARPAPTRCFPTAPPRARSPSQPGSSCVPIVEARMSGRSRRKAAAAPRSASSAADRRLDRVILLVCCRVPRRRRLTRATPALRPQRRQRLCLEAAASPWHRRSAANVSRKHQEQAWAPQQQLTRGGVALMVPKDESESAQAARTSPHEQPRAY